MSGGIFVLLGVAAWVGRGVILEGAAELLIVDDTPREARYIVVLAGDPDLRPRKAAELYRRGLADTVLVCLEPRLPRGRAGLLPSRTEVLVGMLEWYGIPPEAITVIPSARNVTSTYDEAQVLKTYLRQKKSDGPLSVVTSAFHTSRAHWILRRVLEEDGAQLVMVAARQPGYDATNWWESEHGLINVHQEYLKWAYYLWNYR